jgi:hypothetical protein
VLETSPLQKGVGFGRVGVPRSGARGDRTREGAARRYFSARVNSCPDTKADPGGAGRGTQSFAALSAASVAIRLSQDAQNLVGF